VSSHQLLRALAEPRRRRILQLLGDDELAAGEIHRGVGEVSFGAISQHLKVLEQAGAVQVRRDGKRRLYRARRAALRPFRALLVRLWDEQLASLAALAEADERHDRADEPEEMP
jgi:DNA-binding transcriptional ArsR family regulator